MVIVKENLIDKAVNYSTFIRLPVVIRFKELPKEEKHFFF